MTTITSFSFAISLNSLITSSADFLSKEPVGSSAIIIGTFLARARAIDTRCYCPPDNLDTLVLRNLYSFTFLIKSVTFFLRSFLFIPLSVNTNSIFWYTV